MGTATVYADAHLSGSFQNPNNAIGNTPTTWAGQLNVNSNYTSRWSLANLASALTAGATQTINILAKKGSNSGTPTIAINLYENGSLVQSILAATNVTSTTGQTLSGTFNTSAITNPNNVEIEVVQVSAGGGPSVRNSAQIAYIQWVANIDTDPKHVGGGSGGALTVSGAGGGKKATFGGSSGALAITGSGGGGVYLRLSGGSGGSVSITGSGAGKKGASGGSNGSLNISGAGAGVGVGPLLFMTKRVKRNGSLVPVTIKLKKNGSLVEVGGQTR